MASEHLKKVAASLPGYEEAAHKPSPTHPFSVVGIGASAGGLEALQRFFGAVPDSETGLAYIVVSHQNPDHPNLLPDLLQKHTEMPVHEASDNGHVQANCVYLSSPAYNLAMVDGVLRFVTRKMPRSQSAPIDFFFRTMSDMQKDKAICIVLSGTGTDGTMGLVEVKGAGGMAMAQDAESAKFFGMPGSAIATGLVDYVLPPEKMPEHLMQYVQGISNLPKQEEEFSKTEEGIEAILSLLHRRSGNDFSLYKPSTVLRRIDRRMNVHHLKALPDYLRLLQESKEESDALFKELLIGVTAFFRDSAAFEAMEQKILPQLLDAKKDNDVVRVWIPGCSTGEEAFSLAILIREYMERTGKHFHVQIYGTDLDPQAINAARDGLYCKGIELDMSPERLKRYFLDEGEHYRIRKSIREMLIFAVQNVIQDPPFTKLDLISCRNMLIYFNRRLQEKVFPLFHHALKSGGVLFLGASESVGSCSELYTPLDARWKIFRRNDVPVTAMRLNPAYSLPNRREAEEPSLASVAKKKEVSVTQLTEKALLRAFVPPSVVVNGEGEILFIHGKTGAYLEPVAGQFPPSNNLLDMAKEGLKLSLAALLRKAATSSAPVVHNAVSFKGDDGPMTIDLSARRWIEPSEMKGLVLVTFQPVQENDASRSSAPPPSESEELERELIFIKEHLKRTIEELETSNEELKSTNEELQSANEELQSANEEMETSREEMQSLNEELHMVNDELGEKNHDLAYAYDDMKNLLNSTGIASLFLDNQLRIKRFTMQTEKIIHLISSDVGRPVSDIATSLEYGDLIEDAEMVLQTLVFREREVKSKDWCWYRMRIMPYRTANNVIDGLAITFVDISELKKAEILLAAHITSLEMLARNRSLVDIVESTVHTLERQSGEMLFAATLIDGRNQTVAVIAPSLPQDLRAALQETHVLPISTEPFAVAAYRGEEALATDLTTVDSAYARAALGHSLRSCWAKPVLSLENEVLGTLTVFYREARGPSPFENELMQQASNLLGIAISRKQTETKAH